MPDPVRKKSLIPLTYKGKQALTRGWAILDLNQ